MPHWSEIGRPSAADTALAPEALNTALKQGVQPVVLDLSGRTKSSLTSPFEIPILAPVKSRPWAAAVSVVRYPRLTRGPTVITS